MNEINLKGTRWFFTVNPASLQNLNELSEHLASLFNSGAYINPEGFLIETKYLVERINNLKISIYLKEHPPPHFHVEANGINASFRIDNCKNISGTINNKDIKLIEYWHKQCKSKLIEIWDIARPDDCPVGKYIKN